MSLFDLQQRLVALDQERARIIREIDRRRTRAEAENVCEKEMPPDEKVALFLELFGARRIGKLDTGWKWKSLPNRKPARNKWC